MWAALAWVAAAAATAAALAGGALYLHFRRRFAYWAARGVPFLPPSFPFGNMRARALLRLSALEQFHDFYWRLDGRPCGGVFQLDRPCLLLRDPDLIRRVLVKDAASFQDRGIPVDERVNPLSAHLFNLGGAKWRRLRAKLTPTFTSNKMRAMFPLMQECARDLVALVAAEARAGAGRAEVKEALAKFTTDVIGSCAFGLRCNSMRDPLSRFRAMGRRAFEPSLRLTLKTMLTVLQPALAARLRVRVPEKDVSDFFLNVVKETMEYRERHDVQRNDFMQLLLQIKRDSRAELSKESASNAGHAGKKGTVAPQEGEELELTDHLLAAQAFVFFLAGFETSSGTMGFTLLEMALNPEIQRKLRCDISMVLEKFDGDFSHEAIMKMDYLDKVICETLRKYPPLSALVRECNAPCELPCAGGGGGAGVRVEKGVRVLVPVHALHNDPKYFPDPQRFDPERFGDEQRARRHNYTYLPFGEGPRVCVGMRFGQLQTKLGLAMLLHQYHFSICEKTSLPIKFDPKSLLTTTVGGIWLNVEEVARYDHQQE